MQTAYARLKDAQMDLEEAGMRQGTQALQDSSCRAGRRLGKGAISGGEANMVDFCRSIPLRTKYPNR